MWEGKFIDLDILPRSARELSNDIVSWGWGLQIRDGKMCLVKQKHSIFLNFEKWISAFLIFIMLEIYRTRYSVAGTTVY